MSAFHVFLCGVGIGALSFVVAELTIPSTADTVAQHDLALAHRIGFVFPALSGWWIGWLQRSLSRMIAGVAVGSAIGYAYASLCGTGFDFFSIVMGFPCLCGGFFAMLLGSNQDDWVKGMLPRLLKGLLAGLACGVVYIICLNAILAMMRPERHAYMMLRAGIPALGIAGGVFFCIFCWAVGLKQTQTVPTRP